MAFIQVLEELILIQKQRLAKTMEVSLHPETKVALVDGTAFGNKHKTQNTPDKE
jgi:hypothetical protein